MKLFDITTDPQLKEVGELSTAPAPTAGDQPSTAPTSGQPTGGLDPKQAAMMIKQKQDQKKQLQDAIKAKQQEIQGAQKALADMQKQLATLG
jgi:hypothetical protein